LYSYDFKERRRGKDSAKWRQFVWFDYLLDVRTVGSADAGPTHPSDKNLTQWIENE